MKQTKLIMGMPITVEIADPGATIQDFRAVFQFFRKVDEQFSPYKKTSEVSRINRKELQEQDYSEEMREVLALSEKTKRETHGFFDVYYQGYLDPSGMVKGWAIEKAGWILEKNGAENFYVDAGGDILIRGLKDKRKWVVGIRNPFQYAEIIKKVGLTDQAIATSGTAVRGDHIVDPHSKNKILRDIVSLSVIASNIIDADRFATAAFAMGKEGISFINSLNGIEGYMIDKEGVATYTQGFEKYVLPITSIGENIYA